MRLALRPSGRPSTAASWAMRRYASLLYAGGLIAHTADHLRRGTSVLTWEVLWAGNISTLLGVVAITLVLMRHRLAPIVAVATGLPIAVGVASVHLLPHWSSLSDAFPGSHGAGVTPFSWVVVVAEIVGALAMAAAGLQVIAKSPSST